MQATGTAIVEFEDVTKRYRGHEDEPPALDGVSLTIERGEVFGVIGESGSGKSTLLQTINGLLRPDSGSVAVRGRPVADLGAAELRALRGDIGVLFQGVHLLANRTIRQNVALPLTLARGRARSRASRRDERRAVDETLDFVGLSHRAEHYPAQLSGGQRQRAGLARALVGRPALLLCDEPTSSLDAATTAEVLRILERARERLGTTVVLVTHDLDVVKAICDRVALLERGSLRELIRISKSGYRALPSYLDQVRRELLP